MEVRRPYLGKDRRDDLMDRRRDVRHRRFVPWLPDGIEVEKANILFRDSLPNYVINRLKQRLGINELNIQVNTRGDAGPERQRRGEKVEDWLRGCLYCLDPMGFVDGRIREFQGGDGEGWAELEFLKNFTPTARLSPDQSDSEYDQQVDYERQEWGLPLSLNAPDPRSLYRPVGDKVTLVCKVINKPLIDVRDNWAHQG